uniref:Cyanobacterial aminoacyl-tRNA synthetase CAAD domain-containing protein n=1 Tax=Chlamydomonas leiostraca TaxID=1034604 RepID=A0A7S0WZJ5_9CHLO
MMSLARRAAVAPATRATKAVRPLAPRPLPAQRMSPVVRAASPTDSNDFDALLMKMADKFEKAENKPVVIGYIAAAAGAFFFAEWLIHLPALDVLLGFPIQLIGLLALPVGVVRYVLEGKDVMAEAGDAVSSITKRLPGLDK